MDDYSDIPQIGCGALCLSTPRHAVHVSYPFAHVQHPSLPMVLHGVVLSTTGAQPWQYGKGASRTTHKATDILRRRWRAICCYFRFTFSVFHARQKAETVINPKPSNRAFAFGYNRERERAVYSRGKPSTCG